MVVRAFDWASLHYFVDVAHVSFGRQCVYSTHRTIRRCIESRCRHWNHIVFLHIVDDQFIGKFAIQRKQIESPVDNCSVLQIPLVGLLNRPKILLVGLVSVYILTRATFIVTHLDFPYSDDPNNPTPQRQFVTVGVLQTKDKAQVMIYNV